MMIPTTITKWIGWICIIPNTFFVFLSGILYFQTSNPQHLNALAVAALTGSLGTLLVIDKKETKNG